MKIKAKLFSHFLLITLFVITVVSCDTETVLEEISEEFTITSIAIENGELLEAYKCEDKTNGIENSIPLEWENVPANTVSLAIAMYHYPDASNTSEVNSYLLLWDIDPSVTEIAYGTADDGDWFIGANKDETAISYTSPCSPSAGTHEYSITIFALSETPASLPSNSSLSVTYEVLMEAIETVTILDQASITFDDVTL